MRRARPGEEERARDLDGAREFVDDERARAMDARRRDRASETMTSNALDASTSPVALAVSASSSGGARSCARSSPDIARDGVRIHAARTVATVDRDHVHVLVLRRRGRRRAITNDE